MIIAAALLVAYNFWDDSRALTASEEIMTEIDEIRAQKTTEATEAPPSDPQSGLYEETEESLPEYVLDPHMAMPTMEVDGYRYIGTVTIPSLLIDLPIMEEWDYTRMKIAPCRYSGSIYLNDLVVCAHNYNSHFGRLDKLQINDPVIITDADGNTFRYKVEEIETLSGTAVEEMTSGSWDLTLFTCTYSGRARVTVRCKLDE